MSISDNNLPIYFQKYSTDISPFDSEITFSSIAALPTNSINNRLWFFTYQGKMLSTASKTILDIDFSNVTPDDYDITFEGNLSGTLEMYGNVYNALCHISYQFNTEFKIVTLTINNPKSNENETKKPKKSLFSFEIYINDDGGILMNFAKVQMNVRLPGFNRPPRAFWAFEEDGIFQCDEKGVDKGDRSIFVVYNEDAKFPTDANTPIDTNKNIILQSAIACSNNNQLFVTYDPSFKTICKCNTKNLYRITSSPNSGNSISPNVRYTVLNTNINRYLYGQEGQCAFLLEAKQPIGQRGYSWAFSPK